MSKPTAWMPMYWGDYLRVTGHLSTEEHGAYLLLIAHYWSTGKALPDDPKYLMRLTALSEYKFRKYLPALSAFFTIENGLWHHPRIERELSAAFDRKDAAERRGKHAAATRRGDNASIVDAGVKPTYHSHSHIKTHESVSTNSTDAARDPALHGGSGPRASRPETSKERLLRLAIEHRKQSLRKGEP